MKIVIAKEKETFFKKLGIKTFRAYGFTDLIFNCRLETYRKMRNEVGVNFESEYKFVK